MQSGTGKQTIIAREEARKIIKRCCGADEKDVCIFAGSGSTSASNILVHKLSVKEIVQQVKQSKDQGSPIPREATTNLCVPNG